MRRLAKQTSLVTMDSRPNPSIVTAFFLGWWEIIADLSKVNDLCHQLGWSIVDRVAKNAFEMVAPLAPSNLH